MCSRKSVESLQVSNGEKKMVRLTIGVNPEDDLTRNKGGRKEKRRVETSWRWISK